MNKSGIPAIDDLGKRLDRMLAPSLGERPKNLEEVDKLDWELWLLLTLVLICLLIIFILNHAPGLLPPVEMVFKPAELEIYVDGLTVLVLLFCLYVIQKHKQLRSIRNELVQAEVARERFTQRLSIIEVLYGISAGMLSGEASEAGYSGLLDTVRKTMDADVASLYLTDPEGGHLILSGFAGQDSQRPEERVEIGEGIFGRIAQLTQPLLLSHPFTAEMDSVISTPERELISALYVPLIIDDQVWGVLGVGSLQPDTQYIDIDLKLLQVFGNNMALALRRNDLIARLQESLVRNEETDIQLIQAEKLAGLGELMAGISHELNNPLSVIVGNTDLMLRQELGEEMRERLDKMNQEALRAKHLVENLLKAARGEEMIGKEVILNEVVEQALSILRYQVSLDDVRIETVLSEDLPPSVLDPFQIQQLVFNLVNNARQAMLSIDRQSRLIVVTTKLVSDELPGGIGPGLPVHLQVRDTGPGISEQNLGRVFDPFFTTKDVGSGTGLGLSICYRIVQQFGGMITADNHPEGGAVFDIWLPATFRKSEPPADDPSEERTTPPGPSRKGTILLVDDEQNILDLMEEAFMQTGHKIEVALNGQMALEILQNTDPPNAIVLDLKMPVMGGREFYSHLVDVQSSLAGRVVFLTGDTLSDNARSFLESVNRPFLSKPFALDELLEKVEAAMEW
ncbi:ATP-binding protein [Gemmatimonadota bacterium]